MCTFEQCDVKLFPDRHTWFQHELECHRLEWSCHLCSHQSFTSESNLKSHVHIQHADFSTSSQLSALLQVSKQPMDRIPAAACVFCDWETTLRNSNTSNPADETLVVTVEQFRRHLGSHMEALALFALPRNYKDEGEGAESNEAAQPARSASSLPLSLKQRALSWHTDSSHEATQDRTVPDVELGTRSNPLVSPLVSQSGRPSLFQWSSRALDCRLWEKKPFPRYGAAAPQICSENGDLYFHGGLVDGHTVSGDFGYIEIRETPAISCYPIATSSGGPGPRAGAAALLAEQLFIVFGGDTRLNKGDDLDTALYAFDTSHELISAGTKKWMKWNHNSAPDGRYGHTINMVSTKIAVFGGQKDGVFFNDMKAFDLNQLGSSQSAWESWPPHSSTSSIPNARKNHTMVSWADRLYL